MPSLIAGIILAFNLGLKLFQISDHEAIVRGLIDGGYPDGRLWPPFSLDQLVHVQWNTIGEHWIHYLMVSLVGGLALLLNTSSFEEAIGEPIDIDSELRSTGVANLAGGLVGSANGYLSFASSVLSYQLNSQGRLQSFINAAISIGAMLAGMSLLKLFPVFLLGGLTISLGFSVLKAALIDTYQRLSIVEYSTIFIITTVIAYSGFINGVLVGLLMLFVYFVISSSRVNLIKYRGTSSSIRSRVLRPEQESRVLKQAGERVQIFALHGFMFFGSSFRLFRGVGELFDVRDGIKPQFIVLDFADVVGIDSGGMTWMNRLVGLAREEGAIVVFSHLNGYAKKRFQRLGGVRESFASDAFSSIHWSTNIDRGLQWCEDQILLMERNRALQDCEPATDDSGTVSWVVDFAGKASAFVRREYYPAGNTLWQKGDSADLLYLIESGEIEGYSVSATGEQK